MNDARHRARRRPSAVVAALGPLVLALAYSGSSPCLGMAGEALYSDERQDSLIEALNVSSREREPVVRDIYQEMRGPNAARMRRLVREALDGRTVLIESGAVEALAMLGSPDDIDLLVENMEAGRSASVRIETLQLLPAFFIPSDERGRMGYIRALGADERLLPPAILTPLRRPPVSRRGRLNAELDAGRLRIIRALVGQFDPVGSAIAHVMESARGGEAREAVASFVGNALGNDPSRWPENWKTFGREVKSPRSADIEEIRLAALWALGNIGAEGLPEVIDAFSGLFTLKDDLLAQAALETLTSMCRAAGGEVAVFKALPDGVANGPKETEWRLRRLASAKALAIFSMKEAARLLDSRDHGIMLAAASCLGAAAALPAVLDDADGSLREAGEAALREMELRVMSASDDPGRRLALVRALGNLSGDRPVEFLAELAASPLVDPASGRSAFDMAEAVVDSLAGIAGRNGGGSEKARPLLLSLLADKRAYPSFRQDEPPILLGYIVMWRLQRMARVSDVSLEPRFWSSRLGWDR